MKNMFKNLEASCPPLLPVVYYNSFLPCTPVVPHLLLFLLFVVSTTGSLFLIFFVLLFFYPFKPTFFFTQFLCFNDFATLYPLGMWHAFYYLSSTHKWVKWEHQTCYGARDTVEWLYILCFFVVFYVHNVSVRVTCYNRIIIAIKTCCY